MESKSDADTGILLAKLRPSVRLGAAGSSIEPLFDRPSATFGGPLGVADAPQWFVVRVEAAATPWDQAHSQIARQLGIDESDVVFAEPDFVHDIFTEGEGRGSFADDLGDGMALGERCAVTAQEKAGGKPTRPTDGWHLDDGFTQLQRARDSVDFAHPLTRVAHIDTGYYPAHGTTPPRVNRALERNLVRRDDDRSNASDPDNNRLVFDNSGHGTGTLSILAGGTVTSADGRQFVMGGVPDAEIVEIRVADSVVLLRTSSLARALRYAADTGCAVASLSMGGLPSKTWAETVDDVYLAGLCICAAAGNHPGPLPPKRLVYPARYPRVIAVAGVMANGRPYKGLKGMTLEGSYGPDSAMESAIAAYSPNVPWAKFGCPDLVRFNGEGTSAATPQVAAAAALWIEQNKNVLRADWRRVEAVRHALFSSAKTKRDDKHFGNGILQANRALTVAPDFNRRRSPESSNSWAFLRLITGLGIQGPTPREEMFNLELAQRWLMNEDLQELLPDPEATPELSGAQAAALMDALIEDEHGSIALRRHLASRYQLVTGKPPDRKPIQKIGAELPDVSLEDPEIPTPANRRLRVYAKDPSLSSRLATSAIGEVTLEVPWETLRPTNYGFEGEYLAIDDTKERGGYAGVRLDDARLLAQDGWKPSEGNPQFHQQMVYAVASKTIDHFELALGRPVQWRHVENPADADDDSNFAQRLVVNPHALRTANAFYSPKGAPSLRFGYYPAPEGGEQVPGSPVYTCLSHDIIAHETTHAVLDGMHRRFHEPTNPDVLAFHEGFADLVALLQQFEMSELLEHEILQSQGNLAADTLLGKLALQVGNTARGRDSLRSAIGTIEDGEWKRSVPDPNALRGQLSPHARGSVLVGAVFDALLAIYETRTADLLRIATGGTGRLPDGAIHPDLAHRLAREAAKSAGHVVGMCIRALDYLPPVDVTFFDYLRALITADHELVNDDRYNYRVAFVEAFARRAIFPGDHDEQRQEGPRSFSAETLRWPGFDVRNVPSGSRTKVFERYEQIVRSLRGYADECLYTDDRKALFDLTRLHRIKLHAMLKKAFREVPDFARSLGLREGPFEVHTLRRSLRARVDGSVAPEVVVSLTQYDDVAADQATGVPAHKFRGGSTFVVDLAHNAPKYRIVKNIDHVGRRNAAAKFASQTTSDPLRRMLFSESDRFAALHEIAHEGN